MNRSRAVALVLSAAMITTPAASDDRDETFAWSVRRTGDGTLAAALASARRTQFRARCDGATGEFVLDYFRLPPADFRMKPDDVLGFSEIWDESSSTVTLRTRLLTPNHLSGRIAPTPRLLKILASARAGLIAPSEMDEREPLLDSGVLARVAGSCRPPRG